MKAMIFAAGLGTRLKPLTDTRPKALVEIGGQTLLQRLMLKMSHSGIEEVVVNVHHFPDMIIDYLEANNGFGMKWHVSDERNKLLDTGGGLKKAQTLFDSHEPILVHNVDIITNLDFSSLFAAHRTDSLATLVVSERKTQRYLLFDKEGVMHGWHNIATDERKPKNLNIEGLQHLAFSGIQIVSPQIFKAMETYPEKFSITDFYITQCSASPIRAFVPRDYRMMDVGKINEIQEAQSFVEHLE